MTCVFVLEDVFPQILAAVVSYGNRSLSSDTRHQNIFRKHYQNILHAKNTL